MSEADLDRNFSEENYFCGLWYGLEEETGSKQTQLDRNKGY